MRPEPAAPQPTDDAGALAIFLAFLRLGLTSFGGPIAHLAYFRDEFVTRRRWLSERSYADLVALCQFLPGPASSQVGMGLGLLRGGHAGALAAWAGFTLPSAIALTLFALGIGSHGDALPAGVIHGLKVVAVAVVAQAVWGMGRTLCTGVRQLTLMLAAAAAVLLLPGALVQVGVIAAAAGAGLVLFKREEPSAHEPLPLGAHRRSGAALLVLFFVLLLALPLLAQQAASPGLRLADVFYRVGALVFGGGHVVLPLLQAEVVNPGWVDQDVFLAGYGAAQAVPGPLFTFSAFLGASMRMAPAGWLGAAICLLAIFLPAFLLVAGALPFWEQVRHNGAARAALAGVNAAVVGLLLAALYDPIWTSAILRPADFVLALAAFIALVAWKAPPWLVVLGTAIAGGLIGAAT
jgi:chromate transporter